MRPVDVPEDCVRKRVVIDGENFYLVVGKTFVDVTVAHENRPENLKKRLMLQTLCDEITTVLKEL